jgi:hypothetical protein
VPWWVQGIAVIDAAHVMADQPIEGSDDIDYESPAERTYELQAEQDQPITSFSDQELAYVKSTGVEFTESQAWYAARASEHARTQAAVPLCSGCQGWPTDYLCPGCIDKRLRQACHERAASVKLDAERFRFLLSHWQSHMEDGLPLHRWVERHALMWGGVSAALDHAMHVWKAGPK